MTLLIERHGWLLRYVPLFLWIGVIFYLSSSQGSASETSRFIRPILEFFFPAALPETISFYHGIIRKFAHFAEYAVLGLLACRAFNTAALRTTRLLYAWLLVIVVAVLDETNQSLNPSRTGSAVDVTIDVIGGTVAVILFYFFGKKNT